MEEKTEGGSMMGVFEENVCRLVIECVCSSFCSKCDSEDCPELRKALKSMTKEEIEKCQKLK
jgi:hypothetical protein